MNPDDIKIEVNLINPDDVKIKAINPDVEMLYVRLSILDKTVSDLQATKIVQDTVIKNLSLRYNALENQFKKIKMDTKIILSQQKLSYKEILDQLFKLWGNI